MAINIPYQKDDNSSARRLQKAIKMTQNLRTQMIIFEVNSYLHSNNSLLIAYIKTIDNHINTNKKIYRGLYKSIRYIKFFLDVCYFVMIFFEKPFHCYKSTSFSSIKEKNNNDCIENLAMMHTVFLSNQIYRGLEIFFLITFLIIQGMLVIQKEILQENTTRYLILQGFLFSSIFICLGDIIFGLFLDYYPLLNFFLRPIIQILLIKNLRNLWMNIFFLFYDTRNIFFLLLCNISFFGILGYGLFNNVSPAFENLYEAMYSMYILLSTCNFPDVMISTLTRKTKAGVFFFVIYILINYIIIFSILKSMYYSSFFYSFKKAAISMIDIIRRKQENFLTEESLYSFLFTLNKKYTMTNDEYKTIFSLVKGRDYELFIRRLNSYIDEEKTMQKYFVIQFIRGKYIEITINLIDLFLLFFLTNMKLFTHPIVSLIQLIWCSLFIGEYFIYVYFLGLKRVLTTNIIRTLFFIINLLHCIGLLLSLILLLCQFQLPSQLILTCQILLILRLIRVIILLTRFDEFKLIFSTIKNMKTIYTGLMSTLFSFFMIFSTLSMFLTGGKIKYHDFDTVIDIPDNYTYLNFNDFSSSFISCFALTLVNNVNIIARSLSYHNSEYYKSYFSTFYFFSTLVILNICQTLLLEMYLTIKDKTDEDIRLNARTSRFLVNTSIDNSLLY